MLYLCKRCRPLCATRHAIALTTFSRKVQGRTNGIALEEGATASHRYSNPRQLSIISASIYRENVLCKLRRYLLDWNVGIFNYIGESYVLCPMILIRLFAYLTPLKCLFLMLLSFLINGYLENTLVVKLNLGWRQEKFRHSVMGSKFVWRFVPSRKPWKDAIFWNFALKLTSK